MLAQIPHYSPIREQEPCSLFSCFSWLCPESEQETRLKVQAQTLPLQERIDNCCCTKLLALIAIIAGLAVGIIGASLAVPATSLGIFAMALGGASLLIALPTLRSKGAIEQLILGGLVAATITVGALGIGGIVSAQVIGWTMIGSSVGQGILMCLDDPQKRAHRQFAPLFEDDKSD